MKQKSLFKNQLTGTFWQYEDGYGYRYNKDYLRIEGALPTSLTLPLRKSLTSVSSCALL